MQKALAPDISTWPGPRPATDRQPVRGPAERRPSRPGSAPLGSLGEAMSDLLLPRARHAGRVDDPGPPARPYAGSETAETFEPFGVGLVELGDESTSRAA